MTMTKTDPTRTVTVCANCGYDFGMHCQSKIKLPCSGFEAAPRCRYCGQQECNAETCTHDRDGVLKPAAASNPQGATPRPDKATPRPWSLGDCDWRVIVGADTRYRTELVYTGRRETDGSPLVEAKNSLAAVCVIELSNNEAEDLANARLIVQAVNSFEAMRDALRSANKWIAEASEECESRGFSIKGDCETQNQIEAALALADSQGGVTNDGGKQ